MTGEPRTGAPTGNQAHMAEPIDPVAPGSLAAASPSGAEQPYL
jgi:hypothetical protein